MELNPSVLTVFTDGAYRPTKDVGAWAYSLHFHGNLKEESMPTPNTTCNVQELSAAINALSTLILFDHPVVVYTDSQYVKNGITKWIHGWKRSGWKTADKKDVKNKELWIELDRLTNLFRDIRWEWVRGHGDNEFNCRVDELCNLSMDKYLEKQTEKIQ